MNSEKLAKFSQAIEQDDAGRKNILGIVDHIVRELCPSSVYERFDYHRYEEYYNYADKFCDFNYQGISTPDGLRVHLFGPTFEETTKAQLFTQSHIADALKQVALAPDGTQYKVYGCKNYKNLDGDVIET